MRSGEHPGRGNQRAAAELRLEPGPRGPFTAGQGLGRGAPHDLDRLAEDAAFRERFRDVKRENKKRLARVIADLTRVKVDPDSLFDIQIKRIHLYKRQLLNALHVVHLYFRIVEDGIEPKAPRTFVFAGKAAPGYWVAKQVIKLIHSVGERVNRDTRVRGLLKCVFLPDYRVSLAERIIPAADLLLVMLGVLLLLNRNPFKALPQMQAPLLKHRFVNAYAYGLLYGPIALPCSGPLVVGIFALSLIHI